MLCYAMLCYAMLCYAMLCYAMLCYTTARAEGTREHLSGSHTCVGAGVKVGQSSGVGAGVARTTAVPWRAPASRGYYIILLHDYTTIRLYVYTYIRLYDCTCIPRMANTSWNATMTPKTLTTAGSDWKEGVGGGRCASGGCEWRV